jgi:hypothetical protein
MLTFFSPRGQLSPIEYNKHCANNPKAPISSLRLPVRSRTMVTTADEILHGSVIAKHNKVQSSLLFNKKQPQPSAASGFVDAGADVADRNC